MNDIQFTNDGLEWIPEVRNGCILEEENDIEVGGKFILSGYIGHAKIQSRDILIQKLKDFKCCESVTAFNVLPRFAQIEIQVDSFEVYEKLIIGPFYVGAENKMV